MASVVAVSGASASAIAASSAPKASALSSSKEFRVRLAVGSLRNGAFCSGGGGNARRVEEFAASRASALYGAQFTVGSGVRGVDRQQRRSLGVRGLFGLGVPELAVIAGVAAILFGPKQLPEIGKSLGKTVKSFQQAAKEFETEVKNSTIGPGDPTEKESGEAESRPVPPPTPPTTIVTPADKDSAQI